MTKIILVMGKRVCLGYLKLIVPFLMVTLYVTAENAAPEIFKACVPVVPLGILNKSTPIIEEVVFISVPSSVTIACIPDTAAKSVSNKQSQHRGSVLEHGQHGLISFVTINFFELLLCRYNCSSYFHNFFKFPLFV